MSSLQASGRAWLDYIRSGRSMNSFTSTRSFSRSSSMSFRFPIRICKLRNERPRGRASHQGSRTCCHRHGGRMEGPSQTPALDSTRNAKEKNFNAGVVRGSRNMFRNTHGTGSGKSADRRLSIRAFNVRSTSRLPEIHQGHENRGHWKMAIFNLIAQHHDPVGQVCSGRRTAVRYRTS